MRGVQDSPQLHPKDGMPRHPPQERSVGPRRAGDPSIPSSRDGGVSIESGDLLDGRGEQRLGSAGIPSASSQGIWKDEQPHQRGAVQGQEHWGSLEDRRPIQQEHWGSIEDRRPIQQEHWESKGATQSPGVSFVKSSVSGNDCGGPRRAADSPQQEGIATESTECRGTGARAVNDHPREEAHFLSLMNTSEVEGLATNLQTHGSFDYASMERLIGCSRKPFVRDAKPL